MEPVLDINCSCGANVTVSQDVTCAKKQSAKSACFPVRSSPFTRTYNLVQGSLGPTSQNPFFSFQYHTRGGPGVVIHRPRRDKMTTATPVLYYDPSQTRQCGREDVSPFHRSPRSAVLGLGPPHHEEEKDILG
ncbi:hypothetical protein LX32DRAFT_344845 [Colletotrichum zoysiae]|uniref:Uncharacterized protein n=1 Tax=Colletotrichum zoysiae TaxID=1216348 RepID=A0AAD9HJ29_9PEZI|nr:hypothetical protein LX32DRAFT_344845 [Colletotrichum zoysiae]